MNFEKLYTKLDPKNLEKRRGIFSKVVLCKGYYQKGWVIDIKHNNKILFKAQIGRMEFIQTLDQITDKFAKGDSDCTAVELRHFLLKMYGVDRIRGKGLVILWMKKINSAKKCA